MSSRSTIVIDNHTCKPRGTGSGKKPKVPSFQIGSGWNLAGLFSCSSSKICIVGRNRIQSADAYLLEEQSCYISQFCVILSSFKMAAIRWVHTQRSPGVRAAALSTYGSVCRLPASNSVYSSGSIFTFVLYYTYTELQSGHSLPKICCNWKVSSPDRPTFNADLCTQLLGHWTPVACKKKTTV